MNKSSEYLFYNNKENKLSISNIETIFKKLLMQAHINNGENLPRIHDLRFTFIVLLEKILWLFYLFFKTMLVINLLSP